MPPKGHHFIPCLHLRHCAGRDPQGQVWTYDAHTESCWSSITEETAKQTHFYSIEKPDGTMDTRIEEALSGFEGRAVPVYDALLRGDVPKPSKEALADEFKDSRPNMSTEGFGPNKFAPVKVPRRSRK